MTNQILVEMQVVQELRPPVEVWEVGKAYQKSRENPSQHFIKMEYVRTRSLHLSSNLLLSSPKKGYFCVLTSKALEVLYVRLTLLTPLFFSFFQHGMVKCEEESLELVVSGKATDWGVVVMPNIIFCCEWSAHRCFYPQIHLANMTIADNLDKSLWLGITVFLQL